MHGIERPISYLAYQKAEMNRDRKKRTQPFALDDFYWYKNPEDQKLPEPKYGAAAMKLVEMGEFPAWALFVYPDLKRRANDAFAPEVLCYKCIDAIVLAPSVDGKAISGMLIAGSSASGQLRELKSLDGRCVTVRMPVLSGEFVADEEASLALLT